MTTYPRRDGRCFRSQWYEKYNWLEYSVDKDAAFCFSCRNFSIVNTGQSKDTFSVSGFTDWNKALANKRGFHGHETSSDHIAAEQAYRTYMTEKPVNYQVSEVAARQASEKSIQIERNRRVIGRLFDVIRLLGRLGMPFRGHREDIDSSNKGLFKELIEFLANSGDDILKNHLGTMSKNATYLSSTVQNQMINVIGDSIVDAVAEAANESRFYSVLMDETTDASHQEQVSIMVRYVDKQATDEAAVVKERLLAVVCAKETTGEALCELLINSLVKSGLRVEDIVGQGYDGGSNMRGGAKGVQARIKQINPRALYTHCFAHCLNRALVNAVCSRENASARNFFGVVELIYTFVEGSAARHQHFIASQEQLIATNQPGISTGGDRPLVPLHLKGLCDTRWNCRSESLTRLTQPPVYMAVIDTVNYVADTTSEGSVRGVAVGLRKSLDDFSFILQLFCMKPVLAAVNETSVLLQSSQLDILLASQYICNLALELSSLRTESAFDDAMSKASQFAEIAGIDTTFREARRRKIPTRYLDDPCASAYITDVIAQRNLPSAAVELRSDYFFVIDRLVQEVKDRFPERLQMFSPLQCPHMDMLDGKNQLCILARTYELDEERLVAQWRLFRQGCGRKAMSMASCYLKVPPEHEVLRAAYQLLLTLPVTSAGVERCFSKLALIKSKLRTTMSQDRLQSLLLCSVEKDILTRLSSDDLVARFASLVDRRLDLG